MVPQNNIANIPKSLIYEYIDGKPIYYAGYKEVLNKQKKLTDIMVVEVYK